MNYDDKIDILRDDAKKELTKLDEELSALEIEIDKDIVKLYLSIFGENEEELSD
jgi:predicted nucleotidyltransferase